MGGGKRKPVTEDGIALRETIDIFHRRYLGAYGLPPTWGAKQSSMLKRLLAQHSTEEVQRRIGVLFDKPPPWLRPPFDLGTFVQHFDKLVAPQRRPSDVLLGGKL